MIVIVLINPRQSIIGFLFPGVSLAVSLSLESSFVSILGNLFGFFNALAWGGAFAISADCYMTAEQNQDDYEVQCRRLPHIALTIVLWICAIIVAVANYSLLRKYLNNLQLHNSQFLSYTKGTYSKLLSLLLLML